MELDQLAIIDVEPVELDSASSLHNWPCASCGSWHEIESGFVVHHNDCGRSRSAYVCPDCAAPFVAGSSN
ncbi:MAG: hypothetical protein R3343_06760 [Nitriliruptorales bacterium]|nr:hypothetical protein [Nitriliruptorales bacterium]